jgi:hypothetical protein
MVPVGKIGERTEAGRKKEVWSKNVEKAQVFGKSAVLLVEK